MKNKLFLLLIVIIAFIFRLVLLGAVPPGLTNDEADVGYDAYSILLTGKDQWGNFFPLTAFKGFGDYRPAVYTYLVVPSVSVFGLDSFAVRFPSAALGTVTIVLIYLLALKLFEANRNRYYIALFSSILATFSPWPFAISRIGIESNAAITFLLLGILLFLYAFKRPLLFILSFLTFSLTLFTYTSYVLFTPLVIITLIIFYRKEIKKNSRKLLVGIVLFTLFCSPLFLARSAGQTRINQVSFINSQDNVGALANLNDRRGSCSEKFGQVCKITENKYLLYSQTFFKNYINHFSPTFLYLDGTSTQYSILPPGGLLFVIELLFIVLGLIYIVRKPTREGCLVVTLLLLSPIPDAMTGNGHFSRAANMMPLVFIIEGLGIGFMLGFKTKHERLKISASFAVFPILIFSIISFYTLYFSYFPKHFSTFSQYGYEDLAYFLIDQKGDYDKIYVSKFNNDTKQYIYYLFYNKVNPNRFRENGYASWEIAPDGWVDVKRIENIYFVDTLPSEKKMNEEKNLKILFVTYPGEFPKEFKSEPVVQNKNGDIRFSQATNKKLLDFLADNKIFE